MALTYLETHQDLSPASPQVITDSFAIDCTDIAAQYKINPDIPHALLVRTAADITVKDASGNTLTKDSDFYLRQTKRDAYYSKEYSLSSIFSEIQFAAVGSYTVTRHLCVGTYVTASWLNTVKLAVKDILSAIHGILTTLSSHTTTLDNHATSLTEHSVAISEQSSALSSHTANTTDAHGATSEATANKHMVRDANARVQVAAGVANLDAVNKAQMDAAIASVQASSGSGSVNPASTTNTVGNVVTMGNAAGTQISDSGYAIASDATASTMALRDASGNLTANKLVSTVATGTPPLVVSSTTKVTNLNAEQVDGYDVSATAVAGKIPVYNASAKLVGDITGNAPTASSCSGNASTANSINTARSITGTYTFAQIATQLTAILGSSFAKQCTGVFFKSNEFYITVRFYTSGGKVYMVCSSLNDNYIINLTDRTDSFNWTISF